MSNYISGVSLQQIIKMYLAPFAFILMGCLPILFSVNHGQPFIETKLFFIGWNNDGIYQSILLISRCMALISIVFGGFLVLSVSDITNMMRKVRVPSILVELFMFTYKFINNLMHISAQLYVAQKSRLAYGSQISRIKSFSLLMNAIFQSAISRQHNLNDAIESRGGYNANAFSRDLPFQSHQLFKPVVLAGMLVSIFLIIHAYGW